MRLTMKYMPLDIYSMMSSKLDQVQNVEIDSSGRFKYILVKVGDGNNQKHIVRGYRRAAYHGMLLCFSRQEQNKFSKWQPNCMWVQNLCKRIKRVSGTSFAYVHELIFSCDLCGVALYKRDHILYVGGRGGVTHTPSCIQFLISLCASFVRGSMSG